MYIMYKTLGTVSVLFALIIASVEDIKYKKIRVMIPVIVCLVSALFSKVYCNYSMINMSADMSLGMALIIYAVVSRGKIGRGDGIIMCMVGMVSGIGTAVNVMIIASIVSFVYMIIFNISRGIGKYLCMNTIEAPFVPFVTAAYIIINLSLIYNVH